MGGELLGQCLGGGVGGGEGFFFSSGPTFAPSFTGDKSGGYEVETCFVWVMMLFLLFSLTFSSLTRLLLFFLSHWFDMIVVAFSLRMLFLRFFLS